MNPKRLTPDQGEVINSHFDLIEVEFENLSLVQIEELFILYILFLTLSLILYLLEVFYKLHDDKTKIISTEYSLPHELKKFGHQWYR